MPIYAIAPNGTGQPVGARSIEPGWDLQEGETFVAETCNPTLVLAEDGQSLREGTDAELEPLAAARGIGVQEFRSKFAA